MKDNERKFSLPLLETPRTVRIRFRKVGNLQYISHLDLQRTFSRVLVRAGLPLWYTQGFNPHIKMVFALPLPLGCESECELLDVRLEREMTEREIMERLNEELTEELAVTAVYPAERKFTDIAFARYEYALTLPDPAACAQRIREVLSDKELTLTKKSKSGEKEIVLRDYMRSLTVEPFAGGVRMTAVLAAGEGKVLTPEALIGALREKAGLFAGDPRTENYRILRRAFYLSDGVTEFA